VVLLDDVVEALDLAKFDGGLMVNVVAHDRCGIGAALVDGDLLGLAMQGDGALQEAAGCGCIWPGREQEIYGIALAIDCALQVLPSASDLEVGLIHPPALAHGTLASAERYGEHRQYLQHPAMHCGMVNEDSAFLHHLLDVTQAQRVVHPLDHPGQRLDRRFHRSSVCPQPIITGSPRMNRNRHPDLTPSARRARENSLGGYRKFGLK
jgi:hypothetical protein